MLSRLLELRLEQARSSGASKSSQKALHAFATSEQVSLIASQTTRMYADPTLYNAKRLHEVLAVQKKVEGSLSDSLTQEYTRGFDTLDSQDQRETHPGMIRVE